MKYWYKKFFTECRLCGRQSEWRERQYTKKPQDPLFRVEYRLDHCGCID